MRILFCCEFYHPSRGGVQEVMRQIAERLHKAGHEVTVATSFLSERKSDVVNGVRIRSFKVAGNRVGGMRGEADAYREFVRTFDADAILIKAAQQWTFDALWPVLDEIKARKVFIPCGFSSLYEPDFRQYYAAMPDILRKFDHLIVYAEDYRDTNFARAFGITNIAVIPNGASEVEFGPPPPDGFRQRFGIGEDEFVFLTNGSPIAAKGHAELAEAFARLDTGGRRATLILNGSWDGVPATVVEAAEGGEPNAPLPVARLRRILDLAGKAFRVLWLEGPLGLVRRIKVRLKRRSLNESIERARTQPHKRVLCTNLARADLVQAYFAADLFVFASLIEYSPLVLYESVAAGTPFLSVPVGNAEEIARWTGGGIICDASKNERGYVETDPDVLARQMKNCMDDAPRLRELGETGRRNWQERFTWQAIAPGYEAVLAGKPT